MRCAASGSGLPSHTRCDTRKATIWGSSGRGTVGVRKTTGVGSHLNCTYAEWTRKCGPDTVDNTVPLCFESYKKKKENKKKKKKKKKMMVNEEEEEEEGLLHLEGYTHTPCQGGYYRSHAS